MSRPRKRLENQPKVIRMKNYSVNDWIRYKKQETSEHPVPGAHDIKPARKGDSYSYFTDELWQIIDIDPDGSLKARGPDGSIHDLDSNDPHARKVSWIRRCLINRGIRRRASAVPD